MRNTILVLAGVRGPASGREPSVRGDDHALDWRSTSCGAWRRLRDFTTHRGGRRFQPRGRAGRGLLGRLHVTGREAKAAFFAHRARQHAPAGRIRNAPGSRVRVTLPALTKTECGPGEDALVSGFDGASLSTGSGHDSAGDLRNNAVRAVADPGEPGR